MTIHAIYVPGSAALPHNTYDIVGYRTGAFSQYEITNAGIYYFHFAIPTPVLIGNGRAELLDVAVFYDT
ncbi:MAG: hypothetical protein IT492_10255, partial [Gammaproteobacteria bacterium]|nr:hypothetical protein [Gammaproteobacteria bacterium]